jgi:hypothetical protein
MALMARSMSGPTPWRFASQCGSLYESQVFSLRVLPNQRFQWQIDTDLLVCLHEWGTGPGITEDHEFCRSQWKTNSRRPSRMINARKYRQAFCRKLRLEPMAA